ncbi:PQQ-binding-like beta-propeller repeat protein [Actinoplanes sp. L3-i22]|uniref:outer membrane protein assembly factor BamB family protein n=1 Tax=Actinoplanes sp. L3-i22 TaxID=2836373 RepID=UPI001C7548CD|nr:PQQ-binding-like beta-propeller repeat protein [Actinoplanes sp. L3-i22]BCY08409.1 hypothetical protein L3i22_034970 [Actinoplanes sp. L3-i22]
MPVNRGRLWAVLIIVVGVLVAAVVVAVLVGGSDGPDTTPVTSGSAGGTAVRKTAAAGPDGDGGTVAWTTDTKTGSWTAEVVGDTAVLLDGTALLGLNVADGSRRWRLPYASKDTTFVVAGAMVVVQQGNDGPLDVIEPATGRIAWSTAGPARMVARADALYLDPCPRRPGPDDSCVTVKRRVTDGATLWSVKDPGFFLQDNVIGGRSPLAPAATAYLPVTTSAKGPARGALLDTASGRLLAGRIAPHAWYLLAAGHTLVATDHDPAPGDDDCTVRVDAVDAVTGKPAWHGAVYSGRKANGECAKQLSSAYSGTVLLGSGSDVAAVSRNGRATLTDVTTGKVRWTAAEPGVPIAGDDRSLLVRDNAETGPIALLDLATGRKLWAAPDPGLPGSSASWAAVVAGDLVAVMGATGDRPYVLVYDARTGRLLARRGGWLTGIGDGWVMVSTTVGAGAGGLKVQMLRF